MELQTLQIRSYATQTRHLKAEDGKDKVVTTFVASTDCVDRYDDIVDQMSWRLENYKRNPVIPVNHSYSVENIVGRATDLRIEDVQVEGGKVRKALVVDVEWDTGSELGKEVAGKVERGFISAVSVGFRSRKMTPRRNLAEDDGRFGIRGYLLEENELYEISVVAVPANPEALAQRGAASAPELRQLVREAIGQVLASEDFWAEVEARRLAAPAPTVTAPAPAEDLPYWLRC